MVKINGTTFNEKPYMCGVCKWFNSFNPQQSGGRGFCTMFEKQKTYYCNIPKRCAEIFDKAFAIGGEVVIVAK